MFSHVIDDFLNGYIHIVFNDSLVNISNYTLDDAELLEKLATCVQNFLRKNVFFSIDPKIREAFLSGIENFSEIAKCSLLIKNFVSLRKLFTVIAWSTTSFVDFA